MNTPTIEQMNVLIARFEGRKWLGKYTIDNYGGDTGNGLPDMKYHSSWDWLMPCWKKVIDAVAGLTEEGDYPTDFSTIMDMYAYHCENVEIGAAHNYVYQAIQWYNKQKEDQQ